MTLFQIAESVAESVFGDRNSKLLGYEVIPTPGSRVLRLEFEIEGVPRVLFVKTPRESKNLEQTTRFKNGLIREYQLINRISSAFGESMEFDTVSAAGFVNEIHGLVTNEVRGEPLQNLIVNNLRFRYKRWSPELERLSRLAGSWLRDFHSLDLLEDGIDLKSLISSYCEVRLDTLARIEGSKVSVSLAKSLMRDISIWIDEMLFNQETQVVLCHNDYSPHNIIVTDKGICVLDFAYSTPGLPAFDLACFWQKLEDLKGSLLRGNEGLESLQYHFLDAYQTSFDKSNPEVKLGLVRLTLSKMITLLRTHNKWNHRKRESRKRYAAYLLQLKSGFE